MKKHFYSHLVTIETIHIELKSLDMSAGEAKHLTELAESNLHHTVLDTVLTQLESEDKKVFLRQLHVGDHQSVWRFLNKKTNNIENLILKSGENILKKLHEDIKKTKSG